MSSPSVTVTVNDQSIYSENNPTVVPLFIVPTRANKTSPDGNGTALGTTESNQLRTVTSQRELIQALGNPVFVTSAGDPVYGDETNEYGLLALHTFLGLSKRAYYIRPDIDLGALVPTDIEPTLPPPDGTYWMDKDAVVGGIFRFDGSTWNVVPFSVYTTAPTASDGNNGDWCFDYSTLHGTIKFKNGGTWYAATDANLSAQFGANVNMHVSITTPINPDNGDFWYKTSSSAGGVNLKLHRYRASDGVFIQQVVIRSVAPPVPNEGTIWEDLSLINSTASRELRVGTGVEFVPLEMYVQNEQPVTEPDNGTIWFDDTITDFAMYVEGSDHGFGNQWVPIETTTVSNPTALQKVISASAPTMPNIGAIWIDLSSEDKIDDFPVVRRWTGSQWDDITDSMMIQPEDPIASVVLNGTYWINNGESRTKNTVKRYNSDFVAYTVKFDFNTGTYGVHVEEGNHWEPAAGDTFGRKAQRELVVEAMQAAIVNNDAIRSESVYFQLIACPGYPELYDEMVALNTDNGEISFVVADTPKFMKPSGIPVGREITVAEWKTNARNVAVSGENGFASAPTPYAAWFYPWGMATDLNGNDVFVPPSHAALRTIAYSDSVAAPWFPPAGPRRGRVDNLSSVGYLNNDGNYIPLTLTKSQRDIIYEHNINPIAFIPPDGLMIYGQKTNSALTSALDRINVARLIVKMKYDLQRLLQNFLFEINDPVTRRSAQLVTERYLAGLKSLRALYDYAVRADESNNTPEKIDRNELWVDVAIKPAKAIEFIFVPITVMSTGDPMPF